MSGSAGLGVASLVTVPGERLNAAFVQGRARTLWLSGIHRSTSVKADAKVLSGMDLRDALDPLEDQSYCFSAARCDSPTLGKTIGVAPRRSRLWLGLSKSWSDFAHPIRQILELLASTHKGALTPLPILAAQVSTGSTTHPTGAFDIGLVPPELLQADPMADPDDVAEAERWAHQAHFSVERTSSANASGKVSLAKTEIGTFELVVDVSALPAVKTRVTGKAKSAFKAEHAECLKACGRTGWLRVRYDSGHAILDGALFLLQFRDLPFTGFEFEDFAMIDIGKEKPSVLSVSQIGAEDSLFCWTQRSCAKAGRWLACDDGSGEIADFIEVDLTTTPPTLRLHHLKGASNDTAGRPISVSDYEIVVAQAEKNLRSLDRELSATSLALGVGRKVGEAVWQDGTPSDRSKFVKALGQLGANYQREVLIVQPRLLQSSLTRARARPGTPDHARLRQLETLLLAAEASCRAFGARLRVVTDRR